VWRWAFNNGFAQIEPDHVPKLVSLSFSFFMGFFIWLVVAALFVLLLFVRSQNVEFISTAFLVLGAKIVVQKWR
jgi:hypothetical protein